MGPPEGAPWVAQSGKIKEPPYRVPFLFATNGRPYLQQIETESGIWFRDSRLPANLRRALVDWPTPEGLMAQLQIDRQAAQQALGTAVRFRLSAARPTRSAPSTRWKMR